MATKKVAKKKAPKKEKVVGIKKSRKARVPIPDREDTLNHLSAVGVRVIYRSPDSPWIIATFRDKDYVEFTATGNIVFPGSGEQINLQGTWKDTKYGMQFEVSSSYSPPPVTSKGLISYLEKRIEGIGPAKAEVLVKHFGLRLIEVIENSPSELTACSGITPKLAEKISSSWHSDQVDRHLTMYLAKHDIPVEKKYGILAAFGPERAIAIIEANPYELTKVSGIGFVKADSIARKMGYKLDSIERVEAGILFCLQESTKVGHCFLNEGDIIESVYAMTKCERSLISEAITTLQAGNQVKVETISNPNNPSIKYRLIYLPYIYNAEKKLAKAIVEILNTPVKRMGSIDSLIGDFEAESNTTLSPKQKEAVQNAFDHRLSIITGAPGTGKTQTIRAIIYVADKINVKYKLSAPTGRAARRIAEVTNAEACTMHRLLEYREDSGFSRDRTNTLESGVLIVDEFSMPDILLASSLFDAVGDLSNVVLVGDVDQLPAIGPGTVLKDLIDYGKIPTTILDTVFRQAEKSLIVQNAHRIRKGMPPVFLPKGTEADSYSMSVPRTSHMTGKAVEDVSWVKKALADLVKIHIPARMKAQGDFDPIKDIQVIVPMKKGTAGVYELNKMLREQLNKEGAKFLIGNTEWRIGDRVMQMHNNYDLDVSNGDVGFIRAHDPVNKEVLIEFYNSQVMYKYKEMHSLELAYASTVHKVQGSEYPVVIIVMLWQHRPMLEKNLLYTANTRARKMAMYITSPGVTQFAAENIKVQSRNSFLMQRLLAG